ncbi:MAG: cytochrome c3 family protein [Nitrospirota bacterium]|nr:cytochrome c3 family protein [Nitrospirota bacterium]
MKWLSWVKESLTLKGKIIIAVLLLVIIIGGGVVAFKFYDFTQNNPKFCISCHLMKPAYDAWKKSEHTGINCHECHHLTIPEQNRLLITFVLRRPKSVPPRHGKIIVPWKYCIECHWEKDKKYPDAKKINDSRMHAKHYFMEKIECSKCHGYEVHKFTPEERFCLRCHQGKEVHGIGMEGLACLNCHTDRTVDLRPGRKKCLFCHGNEQVRKELIADDTIDVQFFQPGKAMIKKADKINVPKDAPMQFFCYKCHKPHAKIMPVYGTCLNCHPRILNVGRHKLHIQTMGLECKTCHLPHSWRVTKEQAKTTCTKCHEYRDPLTFIGPEG